MFTRTKGKILVLDIGRDRVSLAQFRGEAHRRFELTEFNSAAIEFGHAGNEQACARLIAFLRNARIQFRSVDSLTLTLAPHLAVTKVVHTPAVTGPKRTKIVEFEASQAIPSPLDEVCWDWRVMTEDSEGLEVCLAAVKAEVIHPILAAIAAAGSDVARVVPASLAVRMAFRHLRRAETGAPALVVCIGRSATQLVYLDSERFATRVLALGWAAKEDNAMMSGATELFVQRLNSEIVRSRVHFAQTSPAAQRSDIFLCGEGPLASLRLVLETGLACNVRLFDPIEDIIFARDSRDEVAAVDRTTMVSLAGGAASTAVSDGDCINLVPAELQARRAFRRRQPALACAAGFAVLALVPPTIHLLREHGALRRSLGKCASEKQYLHAARQRGAAYESRLAAANHAAELLGHIEKIRTAWPVFLAEIERNLNSAGDLWLDSLIVRPSVPTVASLQSSVEAGTVEIEISGRAVESVRELGEGESSTKLSEQVKQLLANFRASTLITAVRDERFESAGPGVLRFAMVLSLNREAAL